MSNRTITKGYRHVPLPLLSLDDSLAVAGPVTPLTASLTFSEGRRFQADLSAEPCPRLCGQLLAALAALSCRPGRINAVGTARKYVYSIRQLARFLGRYRADTPNISVSDLHPSDLGVFEDHLRAAASREHGKALYHSMSGIVQLLRWWRDEHPEYLSPDLVERLRYTVDGAVGVHMPRDAYSTHIAEALRQACLDEIPRVIDRIVVRGEAELAKGRDPTLSSWHEPRNVLWMIAQQGTISYQAPQGGAARQPRLTGLTELHALLYPTVRDLVPFLVLLALTTDISVGSLIALKAGCLKNGSRQGQTEIEYFKRRARGHEWGRLQVRDDTRWSPGRIIRLVQQLTRRARAHVRTDRLWVAYGHGLLHEVDSETFHRSGGGKRKGTSPLASFALDHHICDDDGSPLRLDLSRVRKTRRAARYLATGGQLDGFASGVHSTVVAGDHYGDIPSLRPFHEQAIEAGQRDALRHATMRIVPPEEEALLPRQPDGALELERGAVAAERASTLRSGESDLWVCTCTNYWESPFAPAGQACPHPFWRCFDCKNAVITEAHLPGIIAFLNFVVGQRDALDAPEWAAKFGQVYVRIVDRILPAFPDDVVAMARTTAATAGDLAFLPPDLILQRNTL